MFIYLFILILQFLTSFSINIPNKEVGYFQIWLPNLFICSLFPLEKKKLNTIFFSPFRVTLLRNYDIKTKYNIFLGYKIYNFILIGVNVSFMDIIKVLFYGLHIFRVIPNLFLGQNLTLNYIPITPSVLYDHIRGFLDNL